jgi:RNA polymerase sigma factor (sigma-70 family)
LDLTDIIDRFRGPLIGLIASWGANYHDASEMAQDSFADAYLNRESCRGNWRDPEVFGAWLRGIARNRFRNQFRSRKRREKRVISVSISILEATPNPVPVPVDERLERLRDALDDLPQKLKQVVMMHYLEVTSVKDIAVLLCVPPKTIEGRLYQARRELKRMMGEKSTSGIVKALLL